MAHHRDPNEGGESAGESRRQLRVAVQDSRRLVREGVAALLDSTDGVFVVAVLSESAELTGYVADVDIVVCGHGSTTVVMPRVRTVPIDDGAPARTLLLALEGIDDAGTSSPDTGPSKATEPSAPFQVTPREREILIGVARGMSCREIATKLGISAKGVDNHKQRLFQKLGVQSQAGAVAVAYRSGVLRSADMEDGDGFRLTS